MPALLTLLLLFAGLSNSANAQGKPITLKQALELGLNHSYKLKESRANIAIAQANRSRLKDAMLPTASLNANYTRISNNITQLPPVDFGGGPVILNRQILNQYVTRASISEQVFAGFKAKNALASARLLEEAAVLDGERDKADVSISVIRAYYDVYKLEQTRRMINDNLGNARENLANAQSNARNGVVTENDVLRVRLQQTNIEYTLVDVENNLKAARYNLSVMLGLPADMALQPDTASIFSQHAGIPAFDAMLTQAGGRAELKAAGLRLLSSEKEAELLRGNYLPTISVGGNYNYMNPNPRIFPPAPIWKNTWDAGVTFSYNLTNLYTNKHNLANAYAVSDAIKARKESLNEAIQTDLKRQSLAYEREQQKISVANKAYSQAAENYRVTRNKYNSGVSILTELLDADLLLLQARINQSTAKADAEIAWYNMQYALGAL